MGFDLGLVVVTRSLLGLVFLLSGVSKLRDKPSFAQVVRRLNLVPGVAVEPFVSVLPVFELALGLSLLLDFHTRFAFIAATGLLAVFTLVLTVAMARGIGEDCNCFGRLPIRQQGWL